MSIWQTPLFLQIGEPLFDEHGLIKDSQRTPPKLVKHEHLYVKHSVTHVPPFKHGWDAHNKFCVNSQLNPLKPVGQLHWYWTGFPNKGTHTPEFWHGDETHGLKYSHKLPTYDDKQLQ